jgi:hypothetical protein
MLEILLTEEDELPTITTDLDGTIRLKMSWHTGIEEALDLNSDQISSEVKDNFRSLFRDREIQREFEKIDGYLVIRPPRKE